MPSPVFAQLREVDGAPGTLGVLDPFVQVGYVPEGYRRDVQVVVVLP
jgi:hypothetical protein